ncbi:hypothetical protein QIT81_gp55 [Pseudomonas phage MR15]|uniref:Uncharacterized protein n=1 Tax=Pseudomonas phage MR15 TaxID=2711179 RepID=A0A6M3TDZ5_9CAUD|nr:hypothetical protein QIT81_gp55 [Pseudomonas phage MR15]QJD55116.1 hypothetical protein Psm1vBMR13_gp54c [Pseudomonas phage MR13]QJD55269.1 hypothetical protein Psm1vBMR15_gp55c [Pseudomonas phage MR15]
MRDPPGHLARRGFVAKQLRQGRCRNILRKIYCTHSSFTMTRQATLGKSSPPIGQLA